MRADGLHRLRRLAHLLRERDVAALGRLLAEVAELEAEIEALRSAAAGSDDTDLLGAAGASARQRWEQWRTAEIRRLQSRRAELAVREDKLRVAATRAVGRDEALERIKPPRRG